VGEVGEAEAVGSLLLNNWESFPLGEVSCRLRKDSDLVGDVDNGMNDFRDVSDDWQRERRREEKWLCTFRASGFWVRGIGIPLRLKRGGEFSEEAT
jgi:hypothetical protein